VSWGKTETTALSNYAQSAFVPLLLTPKWFVILTSSVLETYPKPLRTLASTATQAAASLFKLSANTSFNNPDIFNNLFLFPRIYDFFNCFLTYQFIPLFSFFILLNSSLSLSISLCLYCSKQLSKYNIQKLQDLFLTKRQLNCFIISQKYSVVVNSKKYFTTELS